MDGVRCLTDPLLGRRVAHLRRTSAAPASVGPVDVVLLSHAHRDHLDVSSLRSLPNSVLVVVPSGLARLVARLGFERVAEVEAGDDVAVGTVSISATPAEHDRGRGIRHVGALPVGYVVRGSAAVYFAGDTDVFDEMSSLARRLDVALLPVSGWGPRVPEGHMDAERAARAAALLEPRIAVPIHWGTLRPFYRRRPYPADVAAPHLFAEHVRRLAPAVDTRILSPGEPLAVAPHAAQRSSDPDDAASAA